MKLKNKILLIIFAVINFFASMLITIFALPNQIPVAYDIFEKISLFSSKWIMLLATIIPTIIVSFLLFTKNKKIQFTLCTLFILSLFENFLFFAYFLVCKNLVVGTLCEIPASISIFMPISIIFTILSIKIKNVPYLSKPALNFKPTKETEFIWKQTHYFAQKVYFIASFLLFIASIIFAIFRQAIIEFILFTLTIIIATIIIYSYSKSIYNKYMEMKERKEKLANKTKPNEATEEKSKKKKKKKKSKKQIDGSNLM